MKISMKKMMSGLLVATFLCAGVAVAAAQEKSDGVMPPPKVLVVFREFLKPGKGGAPHDERLL